MKVLAYTISHGERRYLATNAAKIRGATGMWFDWHVFLGAPSQEAKEDAERLLNDPQHLGIQFLTVWPENRGQHHATAEAFKHAREGGYDWLLRADDDITPKTKSFLKKMVERLVELKDLAKDPVYRIVASPKVIGLNHPIRPSGSMSVGQSFPVDIIEAAGGAMRLMPVPMFSDYEPNLYDPVGRGDPQSISTYVSRSNGLIVRFPDIRVVHATSELESQDTPHLKVLRQVSKVWPWLETPIL